MITTVEHGVATDTFLRVKAFASNRETPLLVVNSAVVRQRYHELRDGFPTARIYYAVKANPAPGIIALLRDEGAFFDVASTYELDRVLSLGIGPERISFGNTIKKRRDVLEAYIRGVRLFASDSEADLRHIADAAPGSRVFVRILTEGSHTADWPLSRKFGCQTDMALSLLTLAPTLGLVPYGVSFHVGSQQRDIGAWNAAIDKVNVIFSRLWAEQGIRLQMINIGGGFPGNYLSRAHEISTYAQEISRYLKEHFGDNLPEIILEPGRGVVADAGVIVSEVVLISRKSQTALNRWIYVDVGKFSGMIETLGEAIKYPLVVERYGPLEEAVLAGPTCDSADILYEDYKYPLPLDLDIGDRLYWMSTGAYTASYSAIEFNGFPPLACHII